MLAYWSTNELPTDIDIVSISGSNRSSEAEYPPSEWLADWPIPVLVDDESGTATQSYGLVYYPFSVIVDGSGTVVTRHVGPLTGPSLESAISFMRGASES
ncbi:MAG: hypothetical protein OEX97_08265 [Acidimicrobiia bacterium]|nr:hypothetical protein [Acidimicrobiia bacterium]